MRALALIKRPPPPSPAQVLCSSHRSRRTFAPMLVHLGALGRHLGANMSQQNHIMSFKIRSRSQHGSKQCPRRLNKPLQPPRIAKNLKKPTVFNYFCYPTHVRKCSQIDAKSTKNRPQKRQVEHQVAILAPTWPNLDRPCSNLVLT